MSNPKFKNRPNDHIVYRFTSPGSGIKIKQDYWISRAAAVSGYIWAYSEAVENPELHILTIKRSKSMMDDPGKIGVPCGYLDWNENGFDAMVREVYEETSLYLYDIEKYADIMVKQPFYVETDPNSNKRQNVCLFYVGVFNFRENPLPDITSFTSEETQLVRWMRLSEFQKEKNRDDWSFNHNLRIQQSYDYLREKYII